MQAPEKHSEAYFSTKSYLIYARIIPFLSFLKSSFVSKSFGIEKLLIVFAVTGSVSALAKSFSPPKCNLSLKNLKLGFVSALNKIVA